MQITSYFVKFFKCIWNGYADAFASKDFRTARRHAKNGNVGAIEYIATLYERGTRVVQKDIVMAYCLYQILVEKKVSKASEKIGSLESQMSEEQLLSAKANIQKWREEICM